MSTPEINTLKTRLLVELLTGGPKEIAEAIEEPYEAVSCVLNNIRPRARVRRKVGDYLASKAREVVCDAAGRTQS